MTTTNNLVTITKVMRPVDVPKSASGSLITGSVYDYDLKVIYQVRQNKVAP